MSQDTPIRLYNSLSRKLEPLVLQSPGRMKLYSCGPTVYSYAHIGNFRTFITADLLVRTARASGLNVTYASNITDVGHLTDDDMADASGEDKMSAALKSKEGERFANVWDLARHYSKALIADWQALNLQEPDVRPRATEHITEQIEAIETLIQKEHAYETESGVYFSVASFPEYGKLSGNKQADQLEAGLREVVIDPNKRDQRDFALWKKDDKHLMQWYSPFGRGFPGWHIECSVMSMKYLGEELDVHAGGEDLAFPHHECEIAQSESLTGKPFARYWLHTRFLQVEGQKMSKSKGNFYTVRDITAPESEGGKGINPLVLRLALMAGHYRKPYNFTHKTLRDCARTVERFGSARERLDLGLQSGAQGENQLHALDSLYQKALNAMQDDLNVPESLAAALEGIKLIHSQENMSKASAEAGLDWYHRINALLGIAEHDNGARPEASEDQQDDLALEVEQLLLERKEARKTRDFERADAIRETLDQMGIEVMDTPEGTRWKKRVIV